jgi:biopolymer transport protein TolQ
VAVDRSVSATDLGGAMHDLSLWGLFLQADWVVKLVMIGLLLASIWVWAIVFEKVTSIRRANREADAFEDAFWSGGSLDELYRREGEQPTHPMAAVFVAAMREWRRSAQRLAGGEWMAAGLRERVDRAMAVTV